jgi:hypothetical protein
VLLTFNTDQTIAWLTDGTADWFWPAAEKAQVPVYFFAPYNVSKFAAIAERNSGLTLIIDHMGLAGSMVKDGFIKEAIDQCVALAKYPNVSTKLSGSLVVSAESYPFRDVAVHLQRVFEAYGPQRCDQLLHQGHLQAAHHSFHRGTAIPVGDGQGLGYGPRDSGKTSLELGYRLRALNFRSRSPTEFRLKCSDRVDRSSFAMQFVWKWHLADIPEHSTDVRFRG